MKENNTTLYDLITVPGRQALREDVTETLRLFIADYYASLIAGYKINDTFNRAMLQVIAEAGGKEEATVCFYDRKLPAGEAAFMNAVYAHGADMDDGNRKSMGHIAAHTMSAVFALAETLDVTWGEVFAAINLGYEVFNRIAAAAQPGLAHRGFHSTGMAGGMACAAACAKLMGLDAEGICSAVSIAAVQSSGLFIITESGQECKPLNPANAARTGILSAKLAAKGVRGPENVLDHPKGWFHAVTDQVRQDMLTDGLGEVFTVQESYLKPYPSCRHTHSVIECAVNIRKALRQIYAEDYIRHIETINVFIYSNAIRVAGQIRKPANMDDAKFSIHYALATALLKGQFALRDLNIEHAPIEIGSIIDKIHIVVDESWENVREGIRGAKVEVITTDGHAHAFSVKAPKGEGANPFTQEDLEGKLKSCAEGILTEKEQEELLLSIRNADLSEPYRPICFRKREV